VQGRVISLSKSDVHGFSKQICDVVELIAGLGIVGDAHAGLTVQHRSRVATDPSQPNLRQVHLISAELLEELEAQGFALAPGDLGENMLTGEIDLHALPQATRLRFPSGAELEVTGLRNPCAQIEAFMPGLLGQVAWRTEQGELVRRAGIMAIVTTGGSVHLGDPIAVTLPEGPHRLLERV
jgi:MOSC domain-containing protein YiiM